jgi:Esterase/lipase
MADKKTTKAILEMRKLFKTGDDKRDEGLPREVEGVKRIDDISYGPDPKWNLLDIYLPENVKEPIPTIINIHGGGYCYGTKETYQFYGLNWAQRGYAFINPNYTLAPESTFPKELDEVNLYIHWVADHAKEYGLDINNVFLIGDSAGGQMAEQYIAILTNPEYRKLFGYELTDLHFRAVALNSPATFLLDSGVISGAVKGYFIDDSAATKEKLNVEKYITKDYLPTYISTATEDFIRNNSIKLDGYLAAKGITHICKMYGDEKNPRGHVFLINQRDDIAKQANDDEMEFFNKYRV